MRKATAAEKAARAALAEAMQGIRADVVEVVSDGTVQRDFGRGRRILDGSTGPLLAAADDFASAYDTHKDTVAAAGVNDARMRSLAGLRERLAGADTSQRSELGAVSSLTADKLGILKTIKAMVGTARKRLDRLGAPSRSQSARRASKPRAKASATPAAKS